MIKKIGIRREDKNIWEKRVSLVPIDAKKLISESGMSLYMQPSPIRIFPDSEYQKVGATVQEDIAGCDLVMGVKEMPLSFFKKDGVYMFFSHTIKGQAHNMPMLKRLMDLNCTLIDYERIVDAKGKRLVFFGKFAGLAGMIDTFWAFGKRLESEGFSTPFKSAKLAHEYPNLDEAKKAFTEIGKAIKKQGLPEKLCPVIFGFAGYGNVSRGAQEIFDLLPYKQIEPKDLEAVVKSSDVRQQLLKVVFKEEHTVKPKTPGAGFDLQEYYQHPDRYESAFNGYLHNLSVLVNCIYWSVQSPRLLSKKEAAQIWKSGKTSKLKVIGDISCDIEGGIECTMKETQPDNPVFVYNPLNGYAEFGVEGNGPVIMAVDNLPCELSAESSVAFSEALMPFLPELLKVDPAESFEKCGLPEPLKKAVCLWHGKFTPDYAFMEKFLK